MDRSLFPTSLKLYHSAVAAVPQQFMALPTEMDSMRLAIMRQIKQKRDGDMAGIETRLEDAIMKWMDYVDYSGLLIMEITQVL